MSKNKVVAILIIIAGTIALVYGQFTYTKGTHEAKFGPFEIRVKEKETVNIPTWAGVGAIAAGVILLLKDKK